MKRLLKVLVLFVSLLYLQGIDYKPVNVVGEEDLPCLFHRNYQYYDLQYLFKTRGIEIENIVGEFGVYTLVINFCQSIQYPPQVCPYTSSIGFLVNNDTKDCITLSQEDVSSTENSDFSKQKTLTLWEYPTDGSYQYNNKYLRVKSYNTDKFLQYSVEFHLYCDRYKETRSAKIDEKKRIVYIEKHGAAGCGSYVDGFMLWIFQDALFFVTIHVVISIYLMFGNWKEPKNIIMLTGWLSQCEIIFFVTTMLWDFRILNTQDYLGLAIACFTALLLTWQIEKKLPGTSMYFSGIYLAPMFSHNIENIVTFFFEYFVSDWVYILINVGVFVSFVIILHFYKYHPSLGFISICLFGSETGCFFAFRMFEGRTRLNS